MTLGKMIGWAGAALGTMRAAVGEYRLRSQMLADHPGLHLGKCVDIRSPHRLKLGKNVILETGVVLHCGGFDWSGGGGGIALGDDCFVGPNCVLFGAGGISLGAKSMLSPGVVIASHGHRYDRPEMPMRDLPSEFKPVVLEENVWVGSNATILFGVTIGAGSVIGAGAVVTKDVPPRSVALGTPARVAKQL
jgi:acetyltransferase-like isoleucine patch superfamily enzyme